MLGLNRDSVIDAAQRVLPAFDRMLMHSAPDREHPVFPDNTFGWTQHLESNWQPIRDEAAALLTDRMSIPSVREISPDHGKIALDGKWRSFFLYAYGVRIDANCAKCPETARIVSEVPGLLSAFFSVMLAGAHVPRHTGPTKAILTAHLGLVVPLHRERCHMDVAGNDVVWEEGRVVVFDDMYPHEVWNDTDEDRIILLIHVKRPLNFPGNALRDAFFGVLRASPFVRDGLRNLEAWKQNAKAA
jgi:aspartyl/asparaginyl beta-hydroxylase (cupin superfamily)